VAAQLQVDNEDPLTRLGQDQREQDVTFADISNHRVYRSAAGITHLATEHQVGSYQWDYLMIMGNISPVLSYHKVLIYSWINSFGWRCK
jgi:hypothetical protein